MHRISFIHQPRQDVSPGRSLRAILASCAFHAAAISLLLWITFVYRSHLPPPSGSAAGAPSISLETMVIVSPPPETISPPAPVPTPQLLEPLVLPKPPEEGVPVLAAQPSKPAPPKIRIANHPAISPAAHSHPRPATAASSSSYAPGLNVLPHPPYPNEARNRGQTGTVVMNVHFDINGNVAQAEIAQPSGVPILDATTRSFIRAHWHSAAYAGQTISQAVAYSLENP